ASRDVGVGGVAGRVSDRTLVRLPRPPRCVTSHRDLARPQERGTMPKKNTATVRRTASRTQSSSPPPPMGLIVTANAAECSASSACGLDNRSHRTPLIPQLPATSYQPPATVPQYN